jgi:hypothetical protein
MENLILGSHVEAVGQHWQWAGHPCLNFKQMCFSAPSGVTERLPVMNLYRFGNALFPSKKNTHIKNNLKHT